MIVNSIDGYRFKSDAHGWTVEKQITRENKKTGEEYEDWVALGYTGSVENCARFLIRYLVRAEDVELDLDDVVAKLRAFADEVQSILPTQKTPRTNVVPLRPKAPVRKIEESPREETKIVKKKRAPRKAKRSPRRAKR